MEGGRVQGWAAVQRMGWREEGIKVGEDTVETWRSGGGGDEQKMSQGGRKATG